MTRPRLLSVLKWLSGPAILCLIASFFFASAKPASAIPGLARKYGLSCADCHVHGAKLNTFGLEFVAKGAKALELEERSPLTPLTVYGSFTARTRPSDNEVISSPSRLELVAIDRINDRTDYFVEWRLFSRDSNDGEFIDRSGRFEDIYIAYDITPKLGLQVGQFRALSQYDITQRVSNSEPLAFASPMAGPAATSQRLTATRAFSPAGRSPGVRLMTNPNALSGWRTAVTVPFGGELSIPIGDEASRIASAELEGTPKGVFIEHYFQKDLDTYGINVFSGSASRSSVGLVGTKSWRDMHFVGGISRLMDRSGDRTVASIDALYARRWHDVYGLRLDLEDGQPAVFVPYMSYHVGAPGSVFRFVIEGRVQSRRRPGLTLELNYLY